MMTRLDDLLRVLEAERNENTAMMRVCSSSNVFNNFFVWLMIRDERSSSTT